MNGKVKASIQTASGSNQHEVEGSMGDRFVVKAYKKTDANYKTVEFYACRSIETRWYSDGGIEMDLINKDTHREQSLSIPSDVSELERGDCTEIIIENMAGNTVHRWMHRSRRGDKSPAVEATSLTSGQ